MYVHMYTLYIINCGWCSRKLYALTYKQLFFLFFFAYTIEFTVNLLISTPSYKFQSFIFISLIHLIIYISTLVCMYAYMYIYVINECQFPVCSHLLGNLIYLHTYVHTFVHKFVTNSWICCYILVACNCIFSQNIALQRNCYM